MPNLPNDGKTDDIKAMRHKSAVVSLISILVSIFTVISLFTVESKAQSIIHGKIWSGSDTPDLGKGRMLEY